MKRLLLLGVDAADLDFIHSRISVLPFFQRALGSGKTFKLESPRALSGSVWPTFYNGVDPGWHGIYQNLLWDPVRMGIRRIGADWCYYQPFWQEIERAGHRAIVLDVPFSFPVTLHNGVEITDWGTHGQTLPVGCNQAKVKALIDRIGKSPMGRETPIQKTSGELEKIRTNLIQSADLKGTLILELMKELDWDVLIAVFGETHRGGHIFFSEGDDQPFERPTPLLEVYQAVDRALAKIVNHVAEKETAVIVFAAHGMAKDYAQRWTVRPLMKRINEVFLEKYCGLSLKRIGKFNSLMPFLRGTIPARLQYGLGAVSSDRIREWVVEKDIIGGLDWPCTPAFALRTDIREEIRLNLKGRESQGMLEPQNPLYAQYIDLFGRVFLDLYDRDTGEYLVKDIVDVHQQFPGPRSMQLPDFVITWHPRPLAKHVYSPLVGEMNLSVSSFARGGDHTDYGFAIIPNQLVDLHPLRRLTDLAGLSRRFFQIA